MRTTGALAPNNQTFMCTPIAITSFPRQDAVMIFGIGMVVFACFGVLFAVLARWAWCRSQKRHGGCLIMGSLVFYGFMCLCSAVACVLLLLQPSFEAKWARCETTDVNFGTHVPYLCPDGFPSVLACSDLCIDAPRQAAVPSTCVAHSAFDPASPLRCCLDFDTTACSEPASFERPVALLASSIACLALSVMWVAAVAILEHSSR